ncbi:MAG: MFS transporter [Actinomycetota bacterium]|nr:MFS transporter [Actinomycetota bacterium]
MSAVRTTSVCDDAQLHAAITPRDDALVLEATAEHGSSSAAPAADTSTGRVDFDCVHGPFSAYRRTVRWTRSDDGAIDVDQEVEYRLAIPYWSRLYEPLVRRALPTGIRRGTRPWWTTPDRLSAGQSTMVAAMALFNLVAGLLYGLLTQVLTFIAADLGDGSRSQQTEVLSAVRLGVVVTVVVMLVADRRGRRRIAVWSFAASAVLTVVTALAPSLWAVAALQLVARNLAIAGLLCVDTIAVEELPPGSRAMVTGLGTLAYGLGAGVIVMTLPLADLGSWGWRLTFVVAGLSLPMIWSAARHLPESGRFVRLDATRRAHHAQTGQPDAGHSAPATDAGLSAATADSAPAPANALAPAESRRIDPRRFVLIASIFLLFNVFVAPASQLQNDYLRTERGFSGLMITVFVLATATPGGLGVLAGGRLADVRGRRAAIVPGLIALGVCNAIFFAVSGAPMWFGSLLGSVLGGLAVPAMGVIAPELFPTARRAGVRGFITAIAVGGSVCGLMIAGPLVDARGYGFTFAVLAVAPLLAAGLAFAIPETRGRELEEINR